MANTALNQTPSAFGALLKDYRVRAGLTQEELAEGSGVSVRAISDMERGIAKSPQRRTIEALAVALVLSDDELTQLQRISKRSRTRTSPAEPLPDGAATPSPPRIFEHPGVTLLPPDLPDLAGRTADLGVLRSFAQQQPGRATRVAVVSGPPGSGKTCIAVRLAYDVAQHFPDGQLFLKLRGMSAAPADPADVLHLMLRSLGVENMQIPAELELRASLCRSLLAERAMLIVLDDAASEAQVRPLIAGGPRCVTVITSRHLLSGVEAAARFSLGALDHEDAIALLGSIVGPGRVTNESTAASELVELCGRLPLAIRVAGNRLASRPMWPLEHLVQQIRQRDRSLTTLSAGDLDVRSVFDMSYRQLSPAAATVFRRLSLVPGADFSVGAATVLSDAGDEDDADIHLDGLVDASLVQPSQEDGRYQLHDLLRTFAKELLTQEEPAQAATRAEERLDDWLVRTATAAGRYFQPSGDTPVPPAPTRWFTDHVRARRWLEAEVGNWRAALRRAAARGHHRQVVDLAESMHWYSEFGGTADLWHEVFDLAVAAAVATGCKRDEAVQRNYLAWALNTLLGRSGEAARMAELAREAAVAAGDPREQGWALIYLGNARSSAGNTAAAVASFDETLRLFDEAGYDLGRHVARSMRAGYLASQGEYRRAAEEFAACIRYFSADGPRTAVDDANLAYLLVRSAQVLFALGDLTVAFDQCEQALELFAVLGSTLGHSRARHISGVILQAQGEHEAARDRLTDALARYERTGQPLQHRVEALGRLAVSAEALGDPAAAHDARERALALLDEMPPSAVAAKLRAELSARPG